MLATAHQHGMRRRLLLDQLLLMQRQVLDALAASWLNEGAEGVCIWGEHLVASWPTSYNAPQRYPREYKRKRATFALLQLYEQPIGWIGVMGTHDEHTQQRLDVDATFINQLLAQEAKLDELSAELMNKHDQLLTLHNLAHSLHNQFDIEQGLRIVAQEILRFVDAEIGFCVIRHGNDDVVFAQVHQQGVTSEISNEAILDIIQEAESRHRDFVCNSASQQCPLPSGVSSALYTPALARRKFAGGVGLLNKAGGFHAPDLKLVKDIANGCWSQLENIDFYNERIKQAKMSTELNVAASIQSQLLPQAPLHVRGLDIFAQSLPASQVGGDFYDFVDERGPNFLFGVGDITGKGVPAAMLMAMTRIVLHSAARFIPDYRPQTIISRVNEDLYNDFTNVGMFATLFMACYDAEKHQISYVNAGHSPVIYCAEGKSAEMLEANGPPMGVLPYTSHQDSLLPFRVGDVLIVATDGFSEATDHNGEMFGYDRLLHLTEQMANRTAGEIAAEMIRQVNAFSIGCEQTDDQTLFIAKGV
jgi:phosphoserine phosphatase RsbU/P